MKFESRSGSYNLINTKSVFSKKSIILLGIMIIFSCLQNYESKNFGKCFNNSK